MLSLLKLFFVIIMVFIAGAIFSYPVYRFGLFFFDTVRFEKVIAHTTSILAIVILFACLYSIQKLDLKSTGLHYSGPFPYKQIILGFIQGIGIILPLGLFLIIIGVRYSDPDISINLFTLSRIALKALITGIVVGILEELLYRGALFGVIQNLSGTKFAIFISSVIYAAAHYVNFPVINNIDSINWFSGLLMLPDSFYELSTPDILDSFLTLFIFGVLLALVRLSQGNILQSIGIHAGVVMSLKINKTFSDFNQESQLSYLVDHDSHMLGYMAVIWLLILTALFCFKAGIFYRLSRSAP